MMVHSNFNNKKVLVTGASGFIGSHLTEALLEISAEVRAFVHYNSRNDWGFLEELSPDAKSSIDIISSDRKASNRTNRHRFSSWGFDWHSIFLGLSK